MYRQTCAEEGRRRKVLSERGARNILEVNPRELPEASGSFYKFLEASTSFIAFFMLPGTVEMG
jgi:hypothetical protein